MIQKLIELIENPKVTRIKITVNDIPHQDLIELCEISKNPKLKDLFIKRSGSQISIIGLK